MLKEQKCTGRYYILENKNVNTVQASCIELNYTLLTLLFFLVLFCDKCQMEMTYLNSILYVF